MSLPNEIYSPNLLKGTLDVNLYPVGASAPYSLNDTGIIFHRPKSTGFFFPDAGTIDFVRTYVTWGEVEGVVGYEFLISDKHKFTYTFLNETIEYPGPPVLGFGDFYLMDLFPYASPPTDYIIRLGEVVPPISPNLDWAYQWSPAAHNILNANYVGIPVYSFAVYDDIYIPTFRSDRTGFPTGAKYLSFVPVPDFGLSELGKRVIFTENINKFNLFVEYQTGRIVYFEIFSGMSYDALPAVPNNSYLVTPTSLPSSDYTVRPVFTVVYAMSRSTYIGQISALLDELEATTSITSPVSLFALSSNDSDFEYLMQYGFLQFGDPGSESSKVMLYTNGTRIARGIIMADSTRLGLFVSLDRPTP